MKEQGFEDLALLLLHRMNSALNFLRHQPLAKANSMKCLGVGAAAKPPTGAVLTPYKGCFRADYRPPLHKMTSTA